MRVPSTSNRQRTRSFLRAPSAVTAMAAARGAGRGPRLGAWLVIATPSVGGGRGFGLGLSGETAEKGRGEGVDPEKCAPDEGGGKLE